MRLFLKKEAFAHEKFQELSKAVRYFKGSEKGRGEMCAVIEEYGMEQREEGREEGRAEMRSLVEEYGMEQREEGRIEGRRDGIMLTRAVFRLDSEGYTVSDIATELSVCEEEVREILEE